MVTKSLHQTDQPPESIALSPLSATYVTDVTLGVSGLWLGTRTGDGGTATLAKGCCFFGAADGSMDNRYIEKERNKRRKQIKDAHLQVAIINWGIY